MSEHSDFKSTVRMYAVSSPDKTLLVGFRIWASVDYDKLFSLGEFLIALANFDLFDITESIMAAIVEKFFKGDTAGAVTDFAQYTDAPPSDINDFLIQSLGRHQALMLEELEKNFEMYEIQSYSELSEGLVLPNSPNFNGIDGFVTLPADYFLYSADGTCIVGKEGTLLYYDLVFTYVQENCMGPGKDVSDGEMQKKFHEGFDGWDGNGGRGGKGKMYGSPKSARWSNNYSNTHPSARKSFDTDFFQVICGCEKCYSGDSPPNSPTEVVPWGTGEEITYPIPVYEGGTTGDQNEDQDYSGADLALGAYFALDYPPTPKLFFEGPGSESASGISTGYIANIVRGEDHVPLLYEKISSLSGSRSVHCVLPLKPVYWRTEEFTPGEPLPPLPEDPSGGGGGQGGGGSESPLLSSLATLMILGLRIDTHNGRK